MLSKVVIFVEVFKLFYNFLIQLFDFITFEVFKGKKSKGNLQTISNGNRSNKH